MRTRRSPRNQMKLWRALGGPPAPRLAPRDPVAVAEKLLAAALADPFTSERTRRQLERDIRAAKIRAARRP